jgi:DtxR family transcriptional regulator, Mn-dependent transcriptional regulator
VITLADLDAGLDATIVDVASSPERRDRLAAFGLVRGTPIRLLQRRPVLVLAIEGTELAIDPKIGSEIHISV